MREKNLIVSQIHHAYVITFNRLEERNVLTNELLNEFHQILNEIEKISECKLVVIKGQKGIFCSGMDLREIQQTVPNEVDAIRWSKQFMLLLKRIASFPKIVISLVDGKVIAGGNGIIAASDYVIATTNSSFSLSEALWGLLPANVLPYLIRRVGFQPAYTMTLTTETISAENALKMHLVDELSDNLDESLNKKMLRFSRIEEKTITYIKQYFRKLWLINDEVENLAICELARLIQEPQVQKNIKRFFEEGKYPWENTNE